MLIKTFIMHTEDQTGGEVTLSELKARVNEGELFGQSYVFSVKDDIWLKIEEIDEIVKDTNIFIKHSAGKISRPEYIPSSIKIKSANNKNSQRENLKIAKIVSEVELRIQKSIHHALETVNRRSDKSFRYVFDQLELMNKNLQGLGNFNGSYEQSDVDREVFKRDMENEIELYRQENSRLLDELKKTRMESDKVAGGGYEDSELVNLKKNLHHKESEIEKANIHIDELNKQVLQFKTTLSRERVRNQKLTRSHIVDVNGLSRDARNTGVELEKIQKFKETRDEQEKKVLYGHNFEISNDTEWYVDNDEGVMGPFSFEQMLDFKDEGAFKEETKIKKEGSELWQRADEIYELTSKSVPFLKNINGKQEKFYLIERKDFRAPFYDIVTFLINGKEEMRGYCTSLSIGGCFIEIAKIEKNGVDIGDVGSVSFNDRVLSKVINIEFVVRTLSLKRPKGIGISFTNLPEESKEILLDYISNFLKNAEKKAV